MQWDVPTDNQNYDNMPATMWTFGKKGNEQVIIENREFDMASGASVFDGQLYVKDGKYFIIDENYTGLADSKLNNREAYTIAEVTDKNALEKAEHGYYNAGGDLLVKKFTFELNDNLVSEHFLNVDDKFFVPSAEQSSSYEFVEVATVPFGNKVGNLPALSRKAYNVKVLDNTLVDNDKTWIYQLVESGRPTYYKAMTETEGDAAGLEKAVFFFKSDEIMGEDNTETYVLIKAETVSGTANTAVSQASLESTAKLAYDELDNIPSQPSTTFAIAPLDVQLYRDLTADKTVKFFLREVLLTNICMKEMEMKHSDSLD